MSWDNWVMDATMCGDDGLLCFCPVNGDPDSDEFVVVTGMNHLSSEPPPQCKRLVGIVHEDGQAAVEAWAERNMDTMLRLGNWEPKT